MGNNVMEKAEKGQLFSRERVLRIGWIMKLFVGVADFFCKVAVFASWVTFMVAPLTDRDWRRRLARFLFYTRLRF